MSIEKNLQRIADNTEKMVELLSSFSAGAVTSEKAATAGPTADDKKAKAAATRAANKAKKEAEAKKKADAEAQAAGNDEVEEDPEAAQDFKNEILAIGRSVGLEGYVKVIQGVLIKHTEQSKAEGVPAELRETVKADVEKAIAEWAASQSADSSDDI